MGTWGGTLVILRGGGGGEVYTQGEFRKHDVVLSNGLGSKTPENVVLVPWDGSPVYWIIEAKARHSQLSAAISEARDYADLVNDYASKSGPLQDVSRFATGIAGSPEHSFYVQTSYWDGEKWKEIAINNYETTGFLSKEQCQQILTANEPEIEHFDDNPEFFLAKANAINKTLHDNEIPVGERAKTIAALLLALAENGSMRIDREPKALIREVNGNVEDLLTKHGKEEYANSIKLTPPATEKNHAKYRKALVDTLQHLREMNIRSAINSGDDALGKFYETFLRYANGAKEMGIVLTPRHITKFAVECLGVGPKDRIYDPTCGTGGFLVSAMDLVRRKIGSASKTIYDNFKNDGLYGVEQRDDVYGLAIVNMIFRGDGKSGIHDGNCLDYTFWIRDGEVLYGMLDSKLPEGASRPFTRVFMNPPFKLKTRETEFVDHALDQMQLGGLLFAVLPAVVIGGKIYSDWREHFLQRHALKAVIKFDTALFYPVSEATYGLIAVAHEPHRFDSNVFFGELFDDEHKPRPSKMMSKHEIQDNLDTMTETLTGFLQGEQISEVDRTVKLNPIRLDGKYVFSPESYLNMRVPELEYNASVRALATIQAKHEVAIQHNRQALRKVDNLKLFKVKEFISCEIPAPIKSQKHYQKGSIPVVSATASNNGISKWLNIPPEQCLSNCVTISKTHNTKPCEAFWHPYPFSAISTVIIVKPIDELIEREEALVYLCEAIKVCNSWRYHYARPVELDELGVYLPQTAVGKPDLKAMALSVRRQTEI